MDIKITQNRLSIGMRTTFPPNTYISSAPITKLLYQSQISVGTSLIEELCEPYTTYQILDANIYFSNNVSVVANNYSINDAGSTYIAGNFTKVYWSTNTI